MEDILIIKIGGNVVDDNILLDSFLKECAEISTPKILIHGGGKIATEMTNRLGIETNMMDGRRITDTQTLQVVTMTYAGWVNKTIVSKLSALGIYTIGLSGADAHIIPGKKRSTHPVNYGWVGDLDAATVNKDFLKTLLRTGLSLVIAPITCDTNGQLLNVNADTVAKVVAQAMSNNYKTTLIYCFEKNGLLADINNEQSIIHELDESKVELLKTTGAISKGMLPKADNALHAIKSGVDTVIIGNALQIKQLAKKEKGYGTRFFA